MVAENAKQSPVGLQNGSKIGKYEVIERLAIGGQAIVYKCRDPLLDRFVAIKQISTHLAADDRFLERFRREAQILARLGEEDSAIVTIHELIEDERGLFIVMEHVPGKSLETVLADNPEPIEPKAALQIIWRLAAGLHAVHSAGIVHRDIKPANIIIAEGLRPKIADFGVAASAGGQTSMVLGTTKYMAPELFSGGPADARADMYSLGFIAYEMLLGRAKFNEVFAEVVRDRHSEALRWMKWHGNEQVQAPLAHEINPAVPQALSEMVAKMMAKNAQDRFANMEELGRAIKTTFSPRGRQSPPKQASRARRHAIQPADLAPLNGAASAQRQGQETQLEFAAPPTAELPRKRLSVQAKLALAGSVLGLLVIFGIGLGVWVHSQKSRQVHAAKLIFTGGQDSFTKGEFKEAAEAFEKVLTDFATTPEAVKAGVMLHLAKANLAVGKALEAKDSEEKTRFWEQAADEQSKAERAVARLSAELNDFSSHVKRKIEDFRSERGNSRKFDDAMSAAVEAMERRRFQQARELLDSSLQGVSLPKPQKDQLDRFRRHIEVSEFKFAFEERMAKAQLLMASNDFAGANLLYDEARKELQKPVADYIEASERDDFYAQVKNAQVKAAEQQELWQAQQDVETAKAANDNTAELAAIERLAKLQPSDDLSQRVKVLKGRLAAAKARELRNKGDLVGARAALLESLSYHESKTVRNDLAQMDAVASRQALIAEGDAAVTAGELDKALTRYQAALKAQTDSKLTPDPNLPEKINMAAYRLALGEGDRLRNQKRYQEAIQAYQKAAQLRPAGAAEINARLADIAQTQQYDGLMAQAQSALADKQWTKARDLFRKAKAVRDTDQARLGVDETVYGENLELGRTALHERNYNLAMAYFRNAQRARDTDEIRKLISDTERAAKEGA